MLLIATHYFFMSKLNTRYAVTMSKTETVLASYILIGSVLGSGIMLTNINHGFGHAPISKGTPKNASDLWNRSAIKGITYFMAWPIMLALDVRAELHRPKGHDHSAFYLYSCRQCNKYHGQRW